MNLRICVCVRTSKMCTRKRVCVSCFFFFSPILVEFSAPKVFDFSFRPSRGFSRHVCKWAVVVVVVDDLLVSMFRWPLLYLVSLYIWAYVRSYTFVGMLLFLHISFFHF